MTTTHATQEQKQKLKKKIATPVQSEEDWCMLPDVEDLEKIVKRELKKLKEFEIVSTKEK